MEVILNLTAVLRPHWCVLQLFNEDDENTALEDFIQMQRTDKYKDMAVICNIRLYYKQPYFK